MPHHVRTVVAPVAAMSEKAWFISAVVKPVRPTQYELALVGLVIYCSSQSGRTASPYPTTVNTSPSSSKFWPEVVTNPVTARGAGK